MSKAKWFLETRPQFLLLSVLLVLHAAALAAWQQGSVDWVLALLSMLGLVLLHGSVNSLNDWHDFDKSGIDKWTVQTPFSGGSGLVPKGVMTAKGALAVGLVTLLSGTAIGLYLTWLLWREGKHVPFLVIGAVGVLSIVLYTPLFNRIWLGEIFAGLGLGTLPIIGACYLFTGEISAAAWASSVPAGLLTYNLLLLNEFPDTEADLAGGRRHMIILLGKRRARWLYVLMESAAYVWLVVAVILGLLTPWALVALIALIFAFRAMVGAVKNYRSFEGLIPAQGMNVAAILSTNGLLAIGYLIAALT